MLIAATVRCFRSLQMIRRSLIVFAAGLSTILLAAQAMNGHGHVVEGISAKRAAGVRFDAVHLFTEAPRSMQSDALWERALTKAGVLHMDGHAATDLLVARTAFVSLDLPFEGRTLTLDLERIDILAEGFTVRSESGTAASAPIGAHYRGMVRGMPGSLATISVFEHEVMGVISDGADDLVLGLFEGDDQRRHVLYRASDLRATPSTSCSTADLPVSGELEQQRTGQGAPKTIRCVHIYWEAAYDLFVNKGSVANVTTYLTGLFNQMATLYANDGVNVQLSEIFVWDTPSPYNGASSGSRLSQFGTTRTSFNGELAHLIDLGGYGGVAWLGTLCSGTSSRMAYSGINTTYQNVPTYSWSVMVVAHETGHNMGSSHTHACVWNGNGTAIDGCGPAAGYTEGSCSAAPVPSPAVGGTIMSYCHLVSAGINLANGFGPQPAQLIRDRVNGATCLLTCGNSCDAPTPLGITALTTTSATLTWGNVGAVSYDLRWKPAASGTWNTIAGLTGATYAVSGLTQTTAYEFQVLSHCAISNSAYSATYAFSTPAPCPDALEPNNSTGAAPVVTLPFSTNALIATTSDADYYKFVIPAASNITIGLNSLPYDYDLRLLDNAGAQLAASANGSNAPEYINYTNASAGTYYVHVFGFNSAFDAFRCYFLYGSAVLACQPPVELSTSALSYNSVTLNWIAVAGATSYNVQWKPSASGTWTTVNNVATNSYPLSGLNGSTSYDFKVATNCGGVQGGSASAYSQPASFITQQAPCDVVPRSVVALRVFLDGPYVGAGFMGDQLRVAGWLPITEPYTAMGRTITGPTTTTGAVLATAGSNAPVDWVLVELRDATTPTIIIEARVGLVQVDGDVVGTDGLSPLGFCTNAGSYRVAVRHRNHMGCMTATAFALNGTSTTVDLTAPATATYGTNARRSVGSVMTLWSGNVNANTNLRYVGEFNDRDPILSAVGGSVPTNTAVGYLMADVNMDGTAKYVGEFNDRDPILSSIGGSVPTNSLLEQLP